MLHNHFDKYGNARGGTTPPHSNLIQNHGEKTLGVPPRGWVTLSVINLFFTVTVSEVFWLAHWFYSTVDWCAENTVELLCLQQRCRLSNLQTACVKQSMEKTGTAFAKLKDTQNKMLEAAGAQKVVLHGCIGQAGRCQHVYRPADQRRTCPQCGQSRYQENGTRANEIVYYFPLRPRLEALLKSKAFLRLLQASQ